MLKHKKVEELENEEFTLLIIVTINILHNLSIVIAL